VEDRKYLPLTLRWNNPIPSMKHFILILSCCYTVLLNAQTPVTSDSARVLEQVVVKAYEQNRQLKEVSAAINYVGKSQLERYNNTSILPALNATPGVRMEERSPGSYRLLINSQGDEWNSGASLNYGLGSYNLQNLSVQVRAGSEERRNTFGFTHQTSDGYRDHTRMRRDVATWETRIHASEKQEIHASVMYGDLYYQTPGGLTEAQYNANPRAARGPAGMFPGADQAKAAIYQKTFLAGLNHTYHFSENFQNSSVVYGAFSQIKNPTFRNYEKRSEPHFGGRTVFNYQQDLGDLQYGVLFGGEAQKGFFNTKTFANSGGSPAEMQTDDDIDTWIYSAFLQIDLHFRGGWSLSAGSSINKSSITIQRLSVPLFEPVKRTFHSEWAPRVSLSKKITPGILLYASVAQGFSPPTTQEVLPSTSVISADLEAEQGINYEAGIKSSWLEQRLYIEVNAFYFRLKNAIVQRRDSSGADYFDNAGSTRQEGIESQAYYQLLPRGAGFLSNAKIWVSHTLNRFRYRDFKQVDNDFSNKRIPSVANNTVAAGLDVFTRPGIYANITWLYSDPIALNDANTAFATSYNLLGGRMGYRKALGKKIIADIFAGVDNAFDVKYSLGNDINAVGGRYYNAAAGVNYFGGVNFQFNSTAK
jgi:iron complex outermembrane receptor protein